MLFPGTLQRCWYLRLQESYTELSSQPQGHGVSGEKWVTAVFSTGSFLILATRYQPASPVSSLHCCLPQWDPSLTQRHNPVSFCQIPLSLVRISFFTQLHGTLGPSPDSQSLLRLREEAWLQSCYVCVLETGVWPFLV